MKKDIFFLCLLFFVLVVNKLSLAQSLNLVSTYSTNIYSPYGIFVLDENRLITVELTSKSGVLNILDLNTGEILNSQRAGRGPGELSQRGKKFITKTEHGNIWVWDNGRKRAFIYDENLNYMTDIISDDKSVTDAIYLNDSTVVVRKLFRSSVIACLNRLENRRISSESFHCFKSGYNNNLSSISDNPLLNQGSMMNFGGVIYLGFDFTSTILTIDNEGDIDTLSTPYYIPFPKSQKTNGNIFEAPDHSKYPMTTIDIGSNLEFVFVLYSGSKFESNLIKQFTGFITGKLAHELEKSENTYQLYIFDKKSGTFLKKILLHNMAKSINVLENHLYALSYVDKNYVINKYRLE
jgi:hypothetical protein